MSFLTLMIFIIILLGLGKIASKFSLPIAILARILYLFAPSDIQTTLDSYSSKYSSKIFDGFDKVLSFSQETAESTSTEVQKIVDEGIKKK